MATSKDAECPTCGRDDFKSPAGMRIHHAKAHDESIAKGRSKVEKICSACGENYLAREYRADESKYCSYECTKKRVERVCEWCGSQYDIPESESDRSRYCSSSCQLEAIRDNQESTKVEIKCESCGDTFYVFPSRREEAKYCSRECMKNRETLYCEWCDEKYEVKQFEVSSSRFCSQECLVEWRSETYRGENHPNWSGGHPDYYGPNWVSQRKKARRRDQHRCQDCGITEPEHISKYDRKNPVHHIKPIRKFRDGGDLSHEAANDLNNLITLCDRCHQKWEQMAPLKPDTPQFAPSAD